MISQRTAKQTRNDNKTDDWLFSNTDKKAEGCKGQSKFHVNGNIYIYQPREKSDDDHAPFVNTTHVANPLSIK